ncbi:MAG: response regulator [Gammaproteobacteria bacterium]|nr:response regulator [Gammaproteobacteria bacterium]
MNMSNFSTTEKSLPPVMVVDDKKENLYSFKTILTNAGFDVVTVDSGVKALKYLIKQPVSLVLMDVQMPEMNGFETARMVRQRQEYHDLPILFISATLNSDEFIRNGYEVGAYDYLTKPIDNQVLVNKVQTFHSLYCEKLALEEKNRATEALNKALMNNEVLQQAVESAKAASIAKDDFLASMSHELRTPLTSIIGNSEFLAESELNTDQQGLLQSVLISGKSLLYLVNDILDSAKIESGKFEIDHAEFDLSVLLHEVKMIFSKRAKESGLLFQVEEEHLKSHHFVGDGKRLGQILINLLGNAVKLTQEGRVTLEVSEDSAAHQIRFVVEDSGIGMSHEVAERIFKPFEQADHSISNRFGGTGLGLYISSSLATLMQGTLRVESEQGKGSRFELLIPLEQAEPTTMVPLVQQQRAERPQLTGTVLIAEVDHSITSLIHPLTTLRQVKYRIKWLTKNSTTTIFYGINFSLKNRMNNCLNFPLFLSNDWGGTLKSSIR